MLRTCICLIFLALSCSNQLLDTAERKRGAFINPKVSTRDISLNQVVRVEFTTTPAKNPDVDVAIAVRTALDLPEASAHWRVIGIPSIEIHERLKTINVGFAIMPRHGGALRLPTIPLRWLDDSQIAEFGNVTVQEVLSIGDSTISLPREITHVAGYNWNDPISIIERRIGTRYFSDGEDPHSRIAKPRKGLELQFRHSRLAKVIINTPDVSISQARSQFISRWGTPSAENTSEAFPSLHWIIGWLTIDVTQNQNGIMLTLQREDIVADIEKEKLQEGVFNLLDGVGATDEKKTTTNLNQNDKKPNETQEGGKKINDEQLMEDRFNSLLDK